MNMIAILHTEADGSLAKAALETLTHAKATGTSFSVGVIGAGAAAACDSIAGCGASAFYAVEGDAFAAPRYASDCAAAVELVKAAGADVVLCAGTSRFMRCMPGAAYRLGAAVDTHLVSVSVSGETIEAQRWYYRQRILATFTRSARPWVLIVDAGLVEPAALSTGSANATALAPALDAAEQRTTVKGVKAPPADGQTIRPDAKMLFVAGAGWTKKQKDGAVHTDIAGERILEFLRKSGASLGSSKSIVDLQSEGQQGLSFISHMNQIGQTGMTPRHAKGLSTCCHGEEPHVVGWRFINDRRAINLDPNCGWAQGKADVVYVADAFEVMEKLNALM
jgi:electron transfer flavoprotein alpha subunit